MAAAINLLRDLDPRVAATHIQRANPFRPIKLMCGNTHYVDVERLDVHRDLANCLHAIRMEDHALFMAQLTNLRNRLDHANLIVGEHDRHQDRLLGHGSL